MRAEGAIYTAERLQNLNKVAGFFPHWLVSDGHNRRAKTPYGLTGSSSAWDDPANAATLQQAIGEVTAGRAGCVGLLAHSGAAGSVVLDFDKVIENEILSAVGSQVTEHFQDAYVEVSPSGTGLRVVCCGKVSPGIFKGSVSVGCAAHSFEVYAAGGSTRFLRMTGATVKGTAGVPGASCQAGIDWTLKQIRQASPDKGNGQSASPAPSNSPNQSIDSMFEDLLGFRPALAASELIESLERQAAGKPRSKLAEAMRGNLKPWAGDNSAADFFLVSEIVRAGADCVRDAVEAWQFTALGKRPKTKRADYQSGTVFGSVQAVLADFRKRPDKAAAVGNVRSALPPEFLASLQAAGDTVATTARGSLRPTAGNVIELFRHHPLCCGAVGLNGLSLRVERLMSWRAFDRQASNEPGPIIDDDYTRLGSWLSREFGMDIKKDVLRDGVRAAARGAAFNPLHVRLKELGAGWDGVHRLGSWLTGYALVDDVGQVEYVSAVGAMFLVGAVARAMQPGCKHDTVLSLEGAGGSGKSTLFKVLADVVLPDLFSDAVQDVSNPVAVVEGTKGRWIVELPELAGVRRAADIEALKASLTRTVETVREPYAIEPESIPRKFVFVATTNRSEYLADSDGALLRRFWPVRSTADERQRMDLKGLEAIAPQLWGEAFHQFEAGARWWLEETDGAAFLQWTGQRADRRELGPFHDELVPVLLQLSEDGPQVHKSSRELAKLCGDMRSCEGDQRSLNALAGTLRQLGMEPFKDRTGRKQWRFTRAGWVHFDTLRRVTSREMAVVY